MIKQMFDYDGCRLMTKTKTREVTTRLMVVLAILEQLEVTSFFFYDSRNMMTESLACFFEDVLYVGSYYYSRRR